MIYHVEFRSVMGLLIMLLLAACGGGSSGAGTGVGAVAGSQELTFTTNAPPGGGIGMRYDTRVGGSCAPNSPNCVCTPASTRESCRLEEHGYQLGVTGGTAPYSFTWAAAAGSALPPGLTLSATGLIDGSPTAAGSYAVVVTVSDASNPAAHTTGNYPIVIAPAPLTITTATLANGVIGTSYNQAIQATGGVAPFVWTVSSGALPHNLSLSSSTTSTETVFGNPDTGAQGVAFTIQVTDSAQHVASETYTVSILPQADILVLSPASLDFGNELVGSASGALTETLTNTASSDMLISGIGTTGPNVAEFNQTTTCGAILAAGASCSINVTFTPGQIGSRSAALTITDDTAGSPQSVALSGAGIAATPNATVSAGNVPFGIQLVGTTSPALSVSLSNYGTAALNISNIAATANFAETDNCVPSLAPGATCKINVTFTPGAAGYTTGMLSISDDAPGNPQNVVLGGTGSITTPLLTGYCAITFPVACGQPKIRVGYSECPPGRGVQHASAIRTCGGSDTVDAARPCSIRYSTRGAYGFCEAK